MTLRKLTLILATAALLSAQADVALQRAIRTETLEGDLKAAIEQYGNLAKSGNRAVAAQALVRMAGCYEKLGTTEARKIYERVVSEFGDHPESVTTAQARLAALRRPQPGAMSLRKVWEGIAYGISPDGRLVTDVDWSKGGDLVVRDVETGTKRWLTDRAEPSPPYVDGTVISPDGRQVAYVWADAREKGPWEFQVRIVPMDGRVAPRVVYRSPNYSFVRDWTQDGESLLLTRSLDDGTWQIAMLSVRDGSIRQLKSFNWGHVDASLSPDGRYIAYDAPVGNGPSRDIHVLATDGSQDNVVVQHPANDHSAVWSPDGSRLLFVSNRTATPSLWSIPVKNGKPTGAAELVKSDTGRPLRMTRSGTLYYVVSGRSRMDVYRAPLGEDGKVSGRPEPVTDQHVNTNWGGTLSPDGQKIAYYSDRPDTVLVVRNFGSGEERVYPLDFEVRRSYFLGPAWAPGGGSVLVIARENQRPGNFLYRINLASGEAEEVGKAIGAGMKAAPDREAVYYRKGGLVRLDLDSGKEETVAQPEPGSTSLRIGNLAISPDGKQIAYLQSVGRETSFAVKPLDGGEPRVVFRTSRLWSSGGRFNTLAWTPDQRYLLFVDGEQEENVIWRVPVDGGEAEQIGITMNARIKFPQIHPDGKSIFFSAVEADTAEVWALENFLPKQTASR